MMDLEYAALVIVPLQLILMAVSGLWIKVTSMPLWLKIAKYFSPFFLSFEGISVVYWGKIGNLGEQNRAFNNETFLLNTSVIKVGEY